MCVCVMKLYITSHSTNPQTFIWRPLWNVAIPLISIKGCPFHRVAPISISASLSQTPAYTARSHIRGTENCTATKQQKEQEKENRGEKRSIVLPNLPQWIAQNMTITRVPTLLMTKNSKTFPGLSRTNETFFHDLLGARQRLNIKTNSSSGTPIILKFIITVFK